MRYRRAFDLSPNRVDRLVWSRPAVVYESSMAYLDNRYLKKTESDFVALISSDIENYVETIHGDSNCVVVFPPVPNRLRFLIHKTVEDFPEVCSFSIGIGDQRRTVVCLQEAVMRNILNESAPSTNEVNTEKKKCQYKEEKEGMDSDSVVCVSQTSSLRRTRKSHRNVSLYVPPGRRTQSSVTSEKISKDNAESFCGESVKESKPSLLRQHHSGDLVVCQSDSTKLECGSVDSMSTDDRVKRLRVNVLESILPTATELKPLPSDNSYELCSTQAQDVVTEKCAETGTDKLASPELKFEGEKPLIIFDAFTKCDSRSSGKYIADSDVIAESDFANTASVDGDKLTMEKAFVSDCTKLRYNPLSQKLSSSVESTQFLDPLLMKELVTAVGQVDILLPPSDYGPYILSDIDLDSKEYSHLVEIYDFPPGTITRDLLVAFRMFHDDRFDIKWVDDTHAIGRFSSAEMAEYAVENFDFCDAKLRPISSASVQTKYVAKQSSELVEPYKPRPETLVSTARNMVTGALGLRRSTPSQLQEKEQIRLNEARERKRESSSRPKKVKEWDGKLGRCAMDME